MTGALLTAILLTLPFASSSVAQPAEGPPAQRRVRAIEGMVESAGEDSIRQFIEMHVAPAYRDRIGAEALVAHVRKIREAASGFGGVLAAPAENGATRVSFMKEAHEVSVLFRLEEAPPHRIVALDLQAGERSPAKGPEVPPLTWESLASRLDDAAKAGFAGTVLVVRDGQIVLHQGYGFANRDKGIPNGQDTIFAIGSVPIDFTRAAVLKLEQAGKIRTSDAITTFLQDVPEDKRTITLDHLMSGRSGLPDFHHVVGRDADPDLTWVDREEALRRIMGQDLLFPPGRGRAHSHSAWVLLAAIVEQVAQEPYGEFLRKNFFEPAGMARTGLHEEAAGFDDREFAVGYEGRPAGTINIPKHWGRTSWLVMGSGGMQSTPRDLYRWLQAIRGGKTLSAASAAKYWKGGALAGDDDRGFFCLYTEGPGNLMILCSNVHRAPGDLVSMVGRRLVELVMPRRDAAAP